MGVDAGRLPGDEAQAAVGDAFPDALDGGGLGLEDVAPVQQRDAARGVGRRVAQREGRDVVVAPGSAWNTCRSKKRSSPSTGRRRGWKAPTPLAITTALARNRVPVDVVASQRPSSAGARADTSWPRWNGGANGASCRSRLSTSSRAVQAGMPGMS